METTSAWLYRGLHAHAYLRSRNIPYLEKDIESSATHSLHANTPALRLTA